MNYTKTENGILTVGQLKELIANLADDVQIIAGVETDYEWANFAGVTVPDNDGIMSVALYTSNTYDARQF